VSEYISFPVQGRAQKVQKYRYTKNLSIKKSQYVTNNVIDFLPETDITKAREIIKQNYLENFFKGTVPRDFSPQLFFMKHISLGP
jgi:hypothetical protein